MPLEVSEHSLTAESPTQFARVLRNDPKAGEMLEAALGQPGWKAFQAVFNARPVALLLLEETDGGWQAVQLVVHPATRGRGVATNLLRQTRQKLKDDLKLLAECQPLAEKAGIT